jgi:hypothetical protein
MGHRCYIPMKHPFQGMKGQFSGNIEKRRPPPHLTSHEVYKMIKDVHVVLGKRKMAHKFTEAEEMCKKLSIFLELLS